MGYERETISLSRDCPALQVPSGEKVSLKKGEVVTLTQALGGSFTVIAADGNMVRISGEHGEALGKEAVSLPRLNAEDASLESVEKCVWELLKTCYDPEIPVNIVDLGLVYRCEVKPSLNDPKLFNVYILMTLTAPGCGMGEVLTKEAEEKVRTISVTKDVEVELTFDPPWSRDMMSEEAQLELGLF